MSSDIISYFDFVREDMYWKPCKTDGLYHIDMHQDVDEKCWLGCFEEFKRN